MLIRFINLKIIECTNILKFGDKIKMYRGNNTLQ